MTEEEKKRWQVARRLMVRRAVMHKHESPWLLYVKEFIKRYQLNEDQSERAMAILKDCQQRAQAFLDRRKAEFNRTLGELESAQSRADKDAVKKHEDKLMSLRKPIDEIFDKQLKPRLDKLPTRAQRAAAEKHTDKTKRGAGTP